MSPTPVRVVPTVAVTAVLGSLVVASYAHVFRGEPGYVESKYWLGMPRRPVLSLVGSQIIAAGGFVALLAGATLRPFHQGLLAHPAALPVLTGVFLAASLVWPFAAREALRTRRAGAVATTSGALVVAAVASALLLAGVFEGCEDSPEHHVAMVGASSLAFIVVLADGIGWNARFLHRYFHGGAWV